MKFMVYVDYTTEELPRPFYVGKGSILRVRLKNRNKLHSAIMTRYGFDRRVVFETDNEKLAFVRECELIAKHNTYVYGGGWGANFTLGGDGTSGAKFPNRHGEDHPMWGRKHTEESKRKNSESNKLATVGEKNGMFGKHHSEETRKKIGDNQRGWKQSAEAKRKISESLKGKQISRKLSEETKRKLSESRKGKAPSNKVVGTYRIIGDASTFYLVTKVRCGVCDILFPESGETTTFSIESVRQDLIKP